MRRINIILGVINLLLAFLLFYYVLVPGLDIEESPVLVQRIYYGFQTSLGLVDTGIKSDFMIKTHKATRVRATDDQNPYTFAYTREHMEIVERDSRRCQACHGSMLQVKDGEPTYPIHEAMLTAPLVRFHCTDCHKTVDLGRRRPSRVTIRVDRTQCTRCHEDKPEGAAPSAVSPTQGLATRLLISNHGTDKKSGRQWIEERHGKVGTSTGVDKCRRCHRVGSELDICGECHGREVPKIKAESR